jgi:hypothetical protein
MSAIREAPHFRDVSYYAMQLRPFVERFGYDRVKILTYEELISHPDQTMAGVFEWLGVAPAAGKAVTAPANATPSTVRMSAAFGVPHYLRRLPVVQTVVDALPRNIRGAATRWYTRPIDRTGVDTRDVEAFLRPIQRPQVAELAAMTGRHFSEWKTLLPEAGAGAP